MYTCTTTFTAPWYNHHYTNPFMYNQLWEKIKQLLHSMCTWAPCPIVHVHVHIYRTLSTCTQCVKARRLNKQFTSMTIHCVYTVHVHMSPGQFGHDDIDNIHRTYHPLIHVHDQHLYRKLTDPMLCHTVSTGTQKVYCICVSKVHDCVLTVYIVHAHTCTCMYRYW